MKINVKSKGTQPTCQMPFVLSCEHWIFLPAGQMKFCPRVLHAHNFRLKSHLKVLYPL